MVLEPGKSEAIRRNGTPARDVVTTNEHVADSPAMQQLTMAPHKPAAAHAAA